ncbi:MAG TPA: recombinase family protein [Steroidobacteraceae bacterium]|nr:recombinase family protein [Steroidobacteraceae bacterium]
MKAALYARYSTELQSADSIEDQFRLCERIAEREGFTVVARFSDAAISGGTAQRPGYQSMLAAARRHAFEVIVAEDTSRLWRSMAEQAPRLAELADLGVEIITHDLDTRTESAGILGAVLGASSEAYRKEIARRTRRGLEGLARNGKSAGGRPFGYVPPALSATGQLEIDEAQAAVVRRIFTLFADGHSSRTIADTLNREGIPSPGSTWAREQRRKRGWVHTVIYGNPTRGLGILNNEIYAARVVWNRSRWIRSAADSSRRRAVLNPRKEWIVREDERLRIVPQALWDRVKARQAEQARKVGARVKRGMGAATARRTGAGPKFLLSGLLRCAQCGSSYAIAGRNRYACSGHTSGGDALCTNNAWLPRQLAEHEVIAGIKREMRSPEVIEEICRRYRAALRSTAKVKTVSKARIGVLRAEVENLVAAIATGALRASPGLAARLTGAESELEQLTSTQAEAAAPAAAEVTRLLADLPARAGRAVDQLEETLASGDVPRAREEIRGHVGTVTVEADEREVRLYGEGVAAALLRAGGGRASNVSSGGRI